MIRGVSAAAALLVLAASAFAQAPDSLPPAGRVVVPRVASPSFPAGGARGFPSRGVVRDASQPLVLHFTVEPSLSQRPVPPLTPDQLVRLRQAQSYREAGLFERARALLVALAAEVPRHAQVLTELARLEIARGDWGAVERLARPERLQQRDSLLLASELILALERLARVREAAEVAVEAWAADPAQDWAADSLRRLGNADPKGVREVLRAAARRLPGRGDLVLAASELEWRSGDPKEALRMLGAAEGPNVRPPLRLRFAEELLEEASGRDSSGAAEALLGLAADTRQPAGFRMPAARRAWALLDAQGHPQEAAARLTRALADVPAEQWEAGFLMDVARALRRAGLTAEARALLAAGERSLSKRELEMEQALADLRDGPPERALPRLEAAATSSTEGVYRYAEALFFAGLSDSARVVYERVAKDPSSAFAGSALERLYLIEDAAPRSALPVFGRIAYAEWRGEPKRAAALTESLYRELPRGPLWAQAALKLASQRDAIGDARGALEPLLAVADTLPGDRLAPLARQRAGDLYLDRLNDAPRALAQYEECLARYPRAWNAAEVRRKLEQLRREGRL